MCAPSGDQLGDPSAAGSVVRCARPAPLLPTTKTSLFPLSKSANAIFNPSGDQVGWMPLVSVVCPLPFAFITTIWPALENAIFCPSGDHAGALSLTLFVV